MVDPLVNAAGHLKPLWQKRPADMAGATVAERKQA